MQNSFTFEGAELGTKICELSPLHPIGYWHLELYSKNQPGEKRSWYLALSQEQIFFADSEFLSWSSFFKIILRYVPSLRSQKLQQEIIALKENLIDEQGKSLMVMTNQMVVKGMLKYEDIIQAIKLQILTDFDTYFFDYQGKAKFISEEKLIRQRPIPGFELRKLLQEVNERREQWQQLEAHVPGIEAIPELNFRLIERHNLTESQKEQLYKLASKGTNLREIAKNSGKDPLVLAKTFASLSEKRLVKLKPPSIAEVETVKSEPQEIFIVDDSKIMLKQFTTFATKLGYKVRCCANPAEAIEEMLAGEPKIIFVDVNMPQISGFQLIKQIRQQPLLAGLPLVILTAEKSLSNKLRADWAKSKFIAKPLKAEEVPEFCEQLRALLEELAPKVVGQ